MPAENGFSAFYFSFHGEQRAFSYCFSVFPAYFLLNIASDQQIRPVHVSWASSVHEIQAFKTAEGPQCVKKVCNSDFFIFVYRVDYQAFANRGRIILQECKYAAQSLLRN